jgi:hypothetical protein
MDSEPPRARLIIKTYGHRRCKPIRLTGDREARRALRRTAKSNTWPVRRDSDATHRL